ncbi:MAG: DUF1905 domain-containing protein [Flavobacteriales bacterium]
MIRFSATIEKFGKKGEKTGWTYIEISAAQAKKLKPGEKKSFRVKGKLDSYSIKHIALIPMGGGAFIMPLNAEMRKNIGKKQGATLLVQLEVDKSEFKMNPTFIDCLQDDPDAHKHFKTLAGSHQRYFSKWIDSAKTDHTKAKRIAMAVNALSKGWGYPEMLRNGRPREI